jgi:gliding motility-associated-like protein
MGGDLTYKNIGNGKVELTFVAYKDNRRSVLTKLPLNITYRVYDASWSNKGNYTHYTQYTTTYWDTTDVQPELPKCAASVSQPVVRGIYKDTITLGNDTVGYHVVWFANERNNTLIQNLQQGTCPFSKQPYGMTWYTFIPPKTIINNSPQFLSSPIPYLCAGRKNIINPVASDPDNDSLIFSLETPYSPSADCAGATTPTPYPPGHTNFTTVTYKSGYSVTYPFGTSSSAISIDATTGEITATPGSSLTGGYVIAIQVKEYRVNPVTHKAQYIGVIRRDLQFIVGTCPTSSYGASGIPQIQIDTSGYTKYVSPGDTLKFTVTGADVDTKDTMFMRAYGGIFAGTPTIKPPYASFAKDTGVKKVVGTFMWVPTCDHITYTTPYAVNIVLSDINCNSVTKTYSIYVKTRPIIKPPILTCADVQSSTKVKVSWHDTLNADSIMKSAFIYHKIYRRRGLTGSFTLIDSLTNYKTLTYTDSKVTGADTVPYSYYITGQNSCGLEGLQSDTITTIVATLKKISDKRAIISWNSALNSKVYYKVLADYGSGYTFVDSTTKLNYVYTACKPVTFSAQIRVDDKTYCSMYSSATKNKVTIQDSVAPDIKTILNGTVLSTTKAAVTFSGSDSTDTYKYYIYRSTDGASFSKFDSITSVASQKLYVYTDASVSTDKHKYCYKIRAVDNCGNLSKYSPVTCLVELTVKTGSLKNLLAWNKYVGYTSDTVEIQSYVSNKWKNLKYVNLTDSAYADSNVVCGNTYYYRIVYRNAANSYYSSSDTVTVTTTDTVPPAQVNLISASIINGSQVNITFNKVPDRDVKKYEIQFRKGSVGSFIPIAIVQPTTWPYTYSQIGTSTLADTLNYRVFAIDSCGGNKSTTAELHKAVHLEGSKLDDAVRLAWSSYFGFTVKNYTIQKRINNTWKDAITGITSTSYTDTGLACNVTQYYRIKAIENGGDNATAFSDSTAVTPYDTVKPGKSLINYVTLLSNTKVYINWAKSKAKDVKQYVIYRKQSSDVNYTAIDTVKQDTFYTDTKALPASVSYDYEVRAMDSCANNLGAVSDKQNTLLIQASTSGCNQKINLSWNAYVNWTSGVKNYLIYRTIDKGSESLYATVSGTTTSYTDAGVNPRHTYTYRVKAVVNNATGYSSFSNTISDTTYYPPQPYIQHASKLSTSATSGQVSVKWTSQKGIRYLSYLRLYYRIAGSGTYSLLKDNIPPSQDSFVHSTLNTNTQDYEYYLVGVDSCGNASDTSSIHKTMNLSMTVGQLIHDLSWTPYKGWQVQGYIIQYKIGSQFVNVDTLNGNTTKLHRFPMPCNHVVSYRIIAMSTKGDLAYSDTASGQAIDTIPANRPVANNITVLGTHKTQLTFTGSDSADVYGYSIRRQDGTGSYKPIGFIVYGGAHASYTFTDTALTTQTHRSYVVVTLDSCLNESYSDTFSPILLKATALNQAATVNWTSFRGYNASKYELQQYLNGSWQTLVYEKPGDTNFLHEPLACYVPRYYRAVVYENGGNRASISDSVMVTPFDTIIPPAPGIRYATAVPGKGIKLEWNWNKKSDVKYFEIWRSVNGGSFSYQNTVVYDSTWTDLSAVPVNKQYAYYVIAIDSCNSNHRSVPSDTDVTMKISATTVACTPLVRLTWTSYTDLPKGTDSYTIYRSTAGGSPVILAVLKANVNQYTDAAVLEGVPYTYVIQAGDIESGYSSITDTITIRPFVIHPPQGVKTLRATVIKSGTVNGQIEIDWRQANLADTFLVGYHVYHFTRPGGPHTMAADITDLTQTTFTATGLNTQDSSNYFYVTPYNRCNEDAMTADTDKVMRLTVQNQNLATQLKWTAYKGFTVDHYEVQRAMQNGPMTPYKIVDNQTLTFQDTTIFCEKNFSYRIVAYEKNGNRQISISDSVTVTGQDTIAPRISDIYAATVNSTAIAGGKVQIYFLGANDKNRAGTIVYRKAGAGVYMPIDTFLDLKTIPLVYIDNNANTQQMANSYYLRSLDSCGNVAMPSDTHTVIWLKVTAKDSRNVLRWTPYVGFGNNQSYLIERRSDTATKWVTLATLPNGSDSFEDYHITCHILYQYRVTAIETGTSYTGTSNTDTATGFEHILPITPEIVHASVKLTDAAKGVMEVSFKPSASADVAHYFIYRSTDNTNWTAAGMANSDATPYITLLDSGINTFEKSWYYKVVTVDSCGNISLDNGTHHKSIALLSVPAEQSVQLHWSAYEGYPVTMYRIYKNGTLITTVDGSKTNYTDTPLTCTHFIRYTVSAVGADFTQIAFSNEDSTKPLDHIAPASPYLFSTSIDPENTDVRVTWNKGTTFDVTGYKVYRQLVGSNDIQQVYSASDPMDTVFTDHLNLGERPYWYMVSATDGCGNISEPSNRGITILLNGRSKSLSHDLNWNGYEQWPDDVDHYTVYRMSDSGSWYEIGTTSADITNYTDSIQADSNIEKFCYRIKAVEKPGVHNATALSTVICLKQQPIVYLPNAFTPGMSIDINDSFGPKGTFFKKYDMSIYNRWGEQVYMTTQSKPWDGKMNGQLVFPGVYMYIIKVEGYDGVGHIFKGNVTIIQ